MYVHIDSFLLLPVVHSRFFQILIFSGILSVTAAVSSNRNSILTVLDVSRGVTHITHNIKCNKYVFEFPIFARLF